MKQVMTLMLTVALAGLIAAPVAAAQSRQAATFKLTETRPGSPTGERFAFDYMNPTDPAAKPPAVKRVTTILPKGGHYDPNVPGSCVASDLELMLLGPAACPVDSRIGGGVITLDTGLPAPARILTADVAFFNNAADPAGEFIYVNTVRATPLRTVIRADVTTGKTITNAPFLPGTLPDGAAIDTVDITLDRITRVIDGQRRGYITTPSRCPRRGYWRSGLRFEYSDIAQTVRTRSRCNR